MIDNINIRYFESRDAEACFKIRRAAFIEKFQQELGTGATVAGINAFVPDDYVRMSQTKPFLVAEENGGIIGFFTIERKDKRVAEIPPLRLEKKLGS